MQAPSEAVWEHRKEGVSYPISLKGSTGIFSVEAAEYLPLWAKISMDTTYERFQRGGEQKHLVSLSFSAHAGKRFPIGNRLLYFVLVGHIDFSKVISRGIYNANIIYLIF